MNRPLRTVVFGTGSAAVRVVRSLSPSYRVIAYADNDSSKCGVKFQGKPVVGPSGILDLHYDRLLIASSSYTEIYRQLVEIRVPKGRIEVADSDIMEGKILLPDPRLNALVWIGVVSLVIGIIATFVL